jgi:superfamily II DNA or RNA helicase
LIVAELRARGAADRVLIITPAGLRDQWAHELSARFSIEALVLDARILRRSIATLAVGVNPWETVPVAIASIDYIKRTEVLAAAGACRWDVVIVDEAHGVAGDSDRQAAVAALAKQSPYVVLLTATPHSGDRRAFASLCGIGASPGEKLVVFRRSRRDLPFGTGRRIHRLHVRTSQAEARMQALLADFSRAIRQQPERLHSNHDVWLALSVLHKRALSSAWSLLQSINRRLATLTSVEEPTSSQLELPLFDLAGELSSADEPPDWSPLLSLEDAARERQLLAAVAEAAGQAAQRETKIGALKRFLRRVTEPAIVFTEYRDTLLHVQASLGSPSVVLHGGMGRDERLAALNQFTSGGSRLLLATDAAGEGLNLQQTCRLVVNLELPWNPMRLEQRIGRVDRIGQRRAVHVLYLIARERGESRLLSRLQSRIARAREDLGGPDPLAMSPGDEGDGFIHHFGDPPSVSAEDPADRRDPDEGWPGGPVRHPTGHETAPRLEELEAAQTAKTLWTPSLEHDGRLEAGRIARARTFVRAGDDQALTRLDALGPAVSTTRRWRTRAVLGTRALMLWQIVAQDGSGRALASTLVTVAVDNHRPHTDEEIRRRVEDAAVAWRQAVTINHRAFINSRRLREHAVVAGRSLFDPARSLLVPPSSSDLFQPGLFERRGERAHRVVVAARVEADRDRVERLATIERTAAVSFLPPHLLLVLRP